jgi:thiamine kinase-like enzyme
LTEKHVNPQLHEKKSSRYAFQLFNVTVADPLQSLKDKEEPGFNDWRATIQFCRRINEVSDVLNSKDSVLKPGSKQERALEDFLTYLNLWECCADPLGLRGV